MRTSFEEQELVRRSVAKLLERCGPEGDGAGRAGQTSALWQALAQDLELLGPGVRSLEDYLPLALAAMEELGAALVAEPFLQTAIIGALLLAQCDEATAAPIREAVGRGRAVFAFAWAEPQGRWNPIDVATLAHRDAEGWRLEGRKSTVSAASQATHFFVTARTHGGVGERDGLSLFLIDRDTPGLSIKDFRSRDGRSLGEVYFEGVRLGSHAVIGNVGGAADTMDLVFDGANVAICSEALGIMRSMLEMTVEYLRTRRQFGAQLGTFQALRHRVADMKLALEQSTSIVQVAAQTLLEPAPIRAQMAAAAKVVVADSCRFVAQSAVQLHGGNGISAEFAVGQFFTRATTLEREFGTPGHYLERYCKNMMREFSDCTPPPAFN